MDWSQYCACNNSCSSVFQFTWLTDNQDDLSPCFQLLLVGSFSLLLCLASVIYLFNFCSYTSHRTLITSTIHYLTLLRCILCLVIAGGVLAVAVLKAQDVSGSNTLGSTLYYVTYSLSAITWAIVAALLYSVRYAFPRFKRAPTMVILLYVFNAALFLKSFVSYWILPEQEHRSAVVVLYTIVSLSHVFLITILIPSGMEYNQTVEPVSLNSDERLSLLGGANSTSSSYQTFPQNDADGRLVGEDGNCFSQLLFWWVQPMMKRGKLGLLQHADQVFHLPKSLDTEVLARRFYDNLVKAEQSRLMTGSPKFTLMSALNSTFGLEYYLLGIMKLLADGLGFAGPLLLNLLINYMENSEEVFWHGYLYAGGLFLSTLVASLLTTHFDYFVKRIQVKLNSAIVSCVYKRMLSVNTVELSRFSTGETVNFMSTDVDRTVNFCASFHQFWSLPFQIAVSLYLLYLQVQWAFLAGVAFAIILIPINRKIAIKIGDLSTKMMKQKDSRVQTMNELIYGIRVVKLFAWEDFFLNRVNEQRSAELSSLKARKYLDALCVYFWATTPVIISILTFTTYILLGNDLTAPKVFTSLALFNMLIGPLNAFPWVVNGLVEAWVSVKRVQQFLNLKTILQSQLWSGDDGSIEVRGGNFSWMPANDETIGESEANSDHTLRLRNIELSLQKGKLIGVIGKVGSGKTSLLLSLLNEMRPTDDDHNESSALRSGVTSCADMVRIGSDKGIGLVTQQAWIQQGTLRDNILMGKPFDYSRYTRAVEASALADDLKNIPDGDKTEVGENGVTLSGGQRARLTLARAIYQDFDIYLLDDPLAAVDTKVARHIFDKCIRGVLKDKARILCTHHLSYLWDADTVLVVDNGEIVAAGAPADILPTYTEAVCRNSDSAKQDKSDDDSSKEEQEAADTGNEEGAGAIVEEEKDSGTVKLHIYTLYASSVGTILSLCIIVSLILMQGSKNVTDWWLSYWISHTGNASKAASNLTNASSTPFPGQHDFTYYLEIYGALAVGNTFFTLFRAFLFAYGGICAARTIHDLLLNTVCKAPMSFFDTTATGRIINRFSTDVYTVDDSLPFIANILLSQLFSILGTVVITIYGLPWFAAVLVPLVLIYYYIQSYYRHTSRELKRLTSTTMSEVYSHLTESVEGRILIRAYNQNERFESENLRRLRRNQRANFSASAASQWLNIRLQGLGVVMVTAIALIAVIEHRYSTVNPGLVGLAISYALSITNLLSGVVFSFTETEKQMVSVERADQYISNVSPECTDESRVPVGASWPSRGAVDLDNVSMRYRTNLPYVLDHVTLSIQPAEKIGIVGRTGSGKSTLFNVLFRMVEEFRGRVHIDGIDINALDLKTLRSRIAIIPQSPFLFSGTIRENLDPQNLYSDDAIWQVLDKCHLSNVVRTLGGLYTELAERGRLFSIGQSQLLCLARAMLLKSKILCIDEATANVDLDTDALIQTTIQQEFKHCTVLTIAHRVSTILHSDRILVMSRGKVVEFAPPNELLDDPSSQLSSIVQDDQNK